MCDQQPVPGHKVGGREWLLSEVSDLGQEEAEEASIPLPPSCLLSSGFVWLIHSFKENTIR